VAAKRASGCRLDQVQINARTRGKALKFDFRVAFNSPGGRYRPLRCGVSSRLRPEIRSWRPRVNLLLEELRKAPSLLLPSLHVADTRG